jgi:uncharacterized protein (DUF433 family)
LDELFGLDRSPLFWALSILVGDGTQPQPAVSWIAFLFWFYNNIPMHLERITIKADVCGGEPTIRGMRITVSHVLEMLAGDMTPAEILNDFPYLEKADIEACLDYAARQAAHREVLLSK